MGPGQRVIAELSTLEKALGKGDLAAQKQPLDTIVRSLRALRVKSLDELELNVKGRLMTTLLRVQRQTKPAQPEAGSQADVAGELVDDALAGIGADKTTDTGATSDDAPTVTDSAA